MSIEFTVSESDACVSGHFPGQPVVPGAYLMARVHRILAGHYPEWALSGWKKVKFMAPLAPGEPARVQWDDSTWPRLKVAVATEAGEVLKGQVTLTPVPGSES